MNNLVWSSSWNWFLEALQFWNSVYCYYTCDTLGQVVKMWSSKIRFLHWTVFRAYASFDAINKLRHTNRFVCEPAKSNTHNATPDSAYYNSRLNCWNTWGIVGGHSHPVCNVEKNQGGGGVSTCVGAYCTYPWRTMLRNSFQVQNRATQQRWSEGLPTP